MAEDYKVEELRDVKVGEPKYQVTAPLKNDPLGKALIKSGALAQVKDMSFRIICDEPRMIFRVPSPVNIYVYPRIAEGEHLFTVAIKEAQRLGRILEAIRLCEVDKRQPTVR